MAKKKSLEPGIKKKSIRTNRCVFLLNDKEKKALDRYLCKYKIQNKAKFLREVIMIEVISRLEKDSPTLFDSIGE